MTTSPAIYHRGERHNLDSPHYLGQCTMEALHRPSCGFFSPSPLQYEGTPLLPISSPMTYDYAPQKLEFLERDHRPSSAGCTSSVWTPAAATLSPPFSDSKSAVLACRGSTPDCGSAVLTSVSTPSIGFENSTPASALSFPSPPLFSGELSSIQHSNGASGLACCAPTVPILQRPLLSSTSSDDSSIPWQQHNLSIHPLSEAPSSSSNSFLALSDPVPSDSSSRPWTPDQAESFKPTTGLEIHNTSYRLPHSGSQTPIEELDTSFGSDQTKALPAPQSKHHTARFLRPIINPTTRVIQTSLTSQLSHFGEDADYFLSSPTFSSHPAHSRSHLAETAPQLFPPSPMGPGLLSNSTSSFGIPSPWLQSNHFAQMDRSQCYSEYENNSDPHPFLLSHSFSPFCDSGTTQALNSQCSTRSASPTQLAPPLIIDGRNENINSLSGAPGRVLMEPVSNWNVQDTSKYKKKKREVREVEAVCGACGERMARLTLRGSPEELHVVDGFELVHTCKLCQEGRPRGASLVGPHVSFLAPFSGQSFLNNVKREELELLYLEPIPQSAMTTFRKRNRRTDDITAPTTCDCCARQLGIGGIVPRNGRSAIQFVVEVVCVYCINNFRRCTDCGGGGGSRLGVGKWRCKELFSDGRRTCILSHQRQGASTEVITTVWKVKDLSHKPELETLVGQLRELVKHSLYAALATPEMLESGLARVTRFDDIKTMYENGWKRVEPLIREDIESSSGRRRYVGLRWTKPHPRKGPKRSISGNCKPSTNPPALNEVVLQPGKELSGFVMSEWDMQQGTFFISVAMPWQSGDALELTTGLAQKSMVKAKADRERLIDEMISQGMNRRDANLRYPPIRHLWTLLFFHRDARLVQFLEKRRKFMPLEEYLSQYPDARREFFPPARECYVPNEQQQGWSVWVRRENGSKFTPQT